MDGCVKALLGLLFKVQQKPTESGNGGCPVLVTQTLVLKVLVEPWLPAASTMVNRSFLVSVFKAGECFMSEAGLTLSEVCWSLTWGCGLANRFRLENWNWGTKPEGQVEPRYWSPVSLDS